VRRVSAARSFYRNAALGALPWLAFSVASVAQDRIIEDVRVSNDRDQAVILIEFGCQMRFVADRATENGALLELRVAPFDSCRELGLASEISRESYQPIGAAAAHLTSIEYDSLGLGDSLVLLSFDRPVDYRVTQRPSLRTVEITVALGEGHEATARVIQDYVINLQSTREPVDRDALGSVTVPAGQTLYVSDIRVDGELWHRLRIGFFATESEAKANLESMRAAFPRAWIGRAEPTEVELVERAAVEPGVFLTLTPKDIDANASTATTASAPRAASPPAPRAASPPAQIDAAQIAALVSDGRAALLEGDNTKAIEIYRQLAAAGGEHRAEALEFLGLAYERAGQLSRARESYEEALREAPDGPGRVRIEQRLNSVIATRGEPREQLREAPASSRRDWTWSTGISQYYRRNENQFDEDQPTQTTQSALMTDVDLGVSGGGERLSMLTRISLSHYRDLLDAEDGGRGNQTRVANAYVDLAEGQQQWGLRMGRQSLHTWGVLGRFDGAHFSHRLGADSRIHMTLGYPVESTRDPIETSRQFAGLALEFRDLVGAWDIAAFLNSQTIEGIDARRAVGMEARYFDDRRNVTAMFDYDIDFEALNTLLVLSTWRLPNGLSLSALVDKRMSPILSTRNALIGQPVATIDELLLVWTEDEIRQLALDRTAQSRTVTLGLAAPMGERLQLNFDVTASEIGDTAASGGVVALPGTGQQLFYSASLIATGFMSAGAVNIWNIRIGNADTYETKLLSWDARFPIGKRLRINPRLRLAFWRSMSEMRERRTVSPSLRLLMNLRNRYRLEFEAGRGEVTRTDARDDRIATGRYIDLGYRVNF
jgi:tetratricopeptide (TPR) repeat protein